MLEQRQRLALHTTIGNRVCTGFPVLQKSALSRNWSRLRCSLVLVAVPRRGARRWGRRRDPIP
eukprot:7095193-Heterocapsa_arctica.AAC.1